MMIWKSREEEKVAEVSEYECVKWWRIISACVFFSPYQNNINIDLGFLLSLSPLSINKNFFLRSPPIDIFFLIGAEAKRGKIKWKIFHRILHQSVERIYVKFLLLIDWRPKILRP